MEAGSPGICRRHRPARSLLCRQAGRVRCAAGSRRHAVSAKGLEEPLRHTFWRNDLLRRTGTENRESQCLAGCRFGQRNQSHSHYYSLPPRHRQQWQTDRLRRRLAYQRKAAGTGAQTVAAALKSVGYRPTRQAGWGSATIGAAETPGISIVRI